VTGAAIWNIGARPQTRFTAPKFMGFGTPARACPCTSSHFSPLHVTKLLEFTFSRRVPKHAVHPQRGTAQRERWPRRQISRKGAKTQRSGSRSSKMSKDDQIACVVFVRISRGRSIDVQHIPPGFWPTILANKWRRKAGTSNR
jgi:hypothetical protein